MSGRFSQARIIAVEIVRGPDHIAIRAGAAAAAVTSPVTAAPSRQRRHSSTTDRSTSPRCIFPNAASTWSSPMVSDTNFSSGSRP